MADNDELVLDAVHRSAAAEEVSDAGSLDEVLADDARFIVSAVAGVRLALQKSPGQGRLRARQNAPTTRDA